ncbi:uncharacterized protein LOC128606843 isoform X2 [Ictalurus furcatus]|uniref:uncharacterized protein LOC128606843 isoform X2 n=1 Tax=Ictalurus furcatus TaxID=66913 RepID=UPI0023507BB0|nr:uncharacterized protein LOC128606843 isoform X2 [Ictalurus furcatus]
MDPMLQHLLEASIQQQTVAQQFAHSLQAVTQELVARRTATPAAATHLPDPGREVQHLLPPLNPEDDIEAYLETFESVARREEWDRDEWPRILSPLLSGEARTAYYSLSPEEAADYGEVKREILAWCGRNPLQAAAEFHRWRYRLGAKPRGQMDTLLRLTKRWLQPDMHSATEVVERVAMDRFLRTLPPTERQAVGMRAPGTSRELFTALEHTLTTQALGKEGQHQQGHPDYGAPQDEPSPTEPDHGTLKKTQKTWPAGRVLPTLDRPKSPQGAKEARVQQAYLARGEVDAGTDGKLHTPSNPLSSVFQQVNWQGNFGREQKEDSHLKYCLAQVRQIEGIDQSPNQRLPSSYFLVKGDLLYHRTNRRGETVDPLVVSKARTQALMHLAHAHLLGGHLGARNTLEKLKDHFVWPGMDAEVWRFCQQCPQCQRTAPRKPLPAPLIPLPIIGIPFERIGMDLVGPLPRSTRGHEYILVIVDYATRYPEAVPLRKTTSRNIAKELVLLFSCVKHLKASVYYQQTDGLVERFNWTLKQLLRRVVDEEGRNWDLLLPYVLFAVRECPQASTGFTPFELLFGRRPRGLLDVAREAWEEQPPPFRLVIEYVQDMQEKIDRVAPIVQEHMRAAQEEQKRVYNCPTQPCEF